MDIIEISHLGKTFGDIKAVDDISFTVKKGEFIAFLGVNGAGKSTTISILCGKLHADCGFVRINGKTLEEDPEGVRRAIGVVFQESTLDRALSVIDNLKTRAALYGITGEEFKERFSQLDSLLTLHEFQNRAVGKLSGGQRRRADIARALIHDPDILILDEPTTGLDPQTRRRVWEIVNLLRLSRGITVFLTTHYMESGRRRSCRYYRWRKDPCKRYSALSQKCFCRGLHYHLWRRCDECRKIGLKMPATW